MSKQTIEMSVAGTDYTFHVTRDAYNRFINSAKDKPAQAMHNFLTLTVEQDQQEQLSKLLQNTPGADMQIGGALFEEYVPDLAVVVKKREK